MNAAPCMPSRNLSSSMVKNMTRSSSRHPPCCCDTPASEARLTTSKRVPWVQRSRTRKLSSR